MDKETLTLYFRLMTEIGIISQLSRAMMDAQLPGNLTTSHFSILNHLIRVKDGQMPLELARAFHLPKTTVTHTLQGLEKLKLIELQPNPNDARSKLVWLTEKGKKFRHSAVQELAPQMARIAEKLKQVEIEPLIAQLEEIRIVMDKARVSEDKSSRKKL